MFAPPIVTVSSMLPPPSLAAVEQPMEKNLLSESTYTQLCFPNEFPYEFISSEDLTATEDETSDDEDNFFAGLTRRLGLSTQRLPSPPSFEAKVKSQLTESTPSGLGSPNGPFSQAPSPPTSPFPEEQEQDSFKVISAAAGEVAKIKKATKPTTTTTSRRRQNPNTYFTTFPPQNAAFSGYWLSQPQVSHYHSNVFIPQTKAALCLQQPALNASRGVPAAANAGKQPSAGTGVFIPQRYPNPSDSKKKSGGGCVKLPTKTAQGQQKPKIETISGRCQPHSQARSKINHAAGGCLKK